MSKFLSLKNRLSTIPGHVDEPEDVVPIKAVEANVGMVCRYWMMPNQQRFMVLGNDDDAVMIAHSNGKMQRIRFDAMIVPLAESTAKTIARVVDIRLKLIEQMDVLRGEVKDIDRY